MNISQLIAKELTVRNEQVMAAIDLLEGGATVPFISRYRKEITGGLNDTQLRQLEERLHYLRELNTRQQTIIKSISEQNKLTPELEQSILETTNKAHLEDLYLPYKPKRRTKAQIAREAGLEPLAFQLLENPKHDPEKLAHTFVDPDKNVPSEKEALEGARAILMEHFAQDATLLGELREEVWHNGIVKSTVVKDKEVVGSKFSDYFNYQELLKKIPSHRALALFRGQREEILTVQVVLDKEREIFCHHKILQQFNISDQNRPADNWLIEIALATFDIKLFFKLELEALMHLRELAEEAAILVFANNLKHLLMAAPAGSRITMGLDPGLRTGVKVVIVDETGKLLMHDVIFPHAPRNEWQQSLATLRQIIEQFKVTLISIGNGTASRETDKLVTALKQQCPTLKLASMVVSEAGASVYSASEFAALEFPDLDVSYRGAVSIARRLQDPLAELIKIEPKSIGVGQYQHDVNQVKLSRTLHAVMEDCVNAVGVDVNMASAPLLACIAGVSETVAKNIITYRNDHGAFSNREQLKKVPRFGEKAYEQAAGFLRIANGNNPLDASAVHPEAYSVVERILKQHQKELTEIVGNKAFIKQLKPTDYTDQQFGLPTILDIFAELEKPGRDPRPEFKTAVFKEGIQALKDLFPGLVLEGVVTNVANFGAFVDIGVHQDGLVHVSMLANRFVKNPHDVVKVGDIVKVKVLEVDMNRHRIQLSMRLSDEKMTAPKAMSTVKKTHQASSDNLLGSVLKAALKKKENRD